nr:MAG TPA: hypothetical protein [Caudoviricetes sp.]
MDEVDPHKFRSIKKTPPKNAGLDLYRILDIPRVLIWYM